MEALQQHRSLPVEKYIKVFILEAGSGDEPLRCTLQPLLFDDAECKFEAISYAWGRHDIVTEIECNGRNLSVTVNLADALRRFRLPSEERILWADAISINQQDLVEKSYEVRRMAEIFHKAQRVLCWLGPDGLGIAKACFDMTKKANRHLAHQWQDGWSVENLIYDLKLPEKDIIGWQNFKFLLELPWFERLWAVQEAGLARVCTMFWGADQAEFYEILELATWFAYSVHAPKAADGTRTGRVTTDVFVDIQLTYRNEPTWRTEAPIASSLDKYYPLEKQLYVDLLDRARFLKVSDQRDTIYSSLGSPLALDPSGDLLVEPNYNEALDSLYIRAAHAFLRHQREASHVLLCVIHNSKEDLNTMHFPSWVPRWNTRSAVDACPLPLGASYEHRLKPYRASCGSTFHVATEPGNILLLTCFVFDTIAWTSYTLKTPNLRSNVELWEPRFRDGKISSVESIWLDLLEHASRTPEELILELSLTLARGRPSSQNHCNDFLSYCEFLRSLAGSAQVSPFPQFSPNKGAPSHAEWVVTRCRDRRLAYTTGKRLALVPFVAELGDICCIIQGMDIPVVLRKVSPGRYKFVGESYVHGAMDGELMELLGRPLWETFRIA